MFASFFCVCFLCTETIQLKHKHGSIYKIVIGIMTSFSSWVQLALRIQTSDEIDKQYSSYETCIFIFKLFTLGYSSEEEQLSRYFAIIRLKRCQVRLTLIRIPACCNEAFDELLMTPSARSIHINYLSIRITQYIICVNMYMRNIIG